MNTNRVTTAADLVGYVRSVKATRLDATLAAAAAETWRLEPGTDAHYSACAEAALLTARLRHDPDIGRLAAVLDRARALDVARHHRHAA